MEIDAKMYRAMAESARTGRSFRNGDGSPNGDMLNAARVGSAQAVMEIAARDLESGRAPADVAAWLREQLAEISLSNDDYLNLTVSRGQEFATRYDRKAREIESARRIYVWVHASVETSRDAYESQCVAEYTTSVGEFLASEHGDYLTHEDLAELAVGEVLTEGNVRVQRLPDVEEKAA